MTWAAEKTSALREMALIGHTYGEIARELGVSRNMVAGKMFRLGIKIKPTDQERSDRCARGSKRAWDADDGTRRTKMATHALKYFHGIDAA